MAKSKHGRDDEFHKGVIRELRKEIKQLRQKIRQLEKQQNNYYDSEETEVDEQPRKCPNCGKGFLKEIEIVNRVFDTCSLCDYRSKTKQLKRRWRKRKIIKK